MDISESTIRRMVEETFGNYLSPEELGELISHVRRHFEVSKELQELDLGGEDPYTTNYIRDRRLVR